MTKYRVTKWANKIEPIEVNKESDSFVWPTHRNGHREKKHSEYDDYFDTWAEAHKFLLDRAELLVIQARSLLNTREDDLRRVRILVQ